jgi:uncharacterized membrane protein
MFLDPVVSVMALAALGLVVLIGAVVVLTTLLSTRTTRRQRTGSGHRVR